MDRILRNTISLCIAITLASCASPQSEYDDDLLLDGGEQEVVADSAEATGDDFADFEDEPSGSSESKTESQAANESQDDELTLDDEPSSSEEVAEQAPPPAEEPAAPATEEEPPAEIVQAPEPETPVESVPAPTPMETPSGPMATITGIKYKANDNGGTVVIEADGPITYTTRSNPELRQLIVEIPNTILPKKWQRPLNTRDIQGSIGAIDPYQNPGSNVSRFVIQLREGAGEPNIHQDGNAVMLVAGGSMSPMTTSENVDLSRPDTSANMDLNSDGILASHSLAEFLSGNTKFYGKRISIETSGMDVRDALRFITEESGVNMVIAEEVRGSISLKLRQVPWDQALVMLMKAKGLGYSRQGNVLRIATLEQLRKEEDDATKLVQSKRAIEPLKVRMFPISYAQVADLEKRVTAFLSERGKVVGDVRTNSLVVTDIEEYLGRVEKLVRSLDTQPPQVLIEAKIVEATENFMRNIGINWGMRNGETNFGSGRFGPVTLRPQLELNNINPAGSSLLYDMTVGTLDLLGDLTATLALNERDSKVKVISSPRIATLSNETANISQTTEVPVKQVTAVAQGTPQTTYSFKPLTLKLEVTPQITADASIIMKVHLKREFRGASAADAQSEAFSVNSREANTRILVKNGQTAVIGGIYQSDATEGESGVPYLRELPFIGAFFRGRTTTKDKSELLLFLTPRVAAQIGTSNDAVIKDM